MLKKSLVVQIIALIVGATLGMTLMNKFDENLKMAHIIVGVLISLTSIATVYLAVYEKAGRTTVALAALALVFVALAATGGRMTNTNYDLGLTLMRISAIVALGLSAVCLYTARKQA